MAIEIERKFLVDIKNVPESKTVNTLHQAYLMIEKGKNLRVRIVNQTKAFICYKTSVSDTTRNEYEYEIPYKDGFEMFNASDMKLAKTRRTFKPHPNIQIDVDIFHNGVAWAEIEYADNSEETLNYPLPKWFKEEITVSKLYNNITIAKGEFPNDKIN